MKLSNFANLSSVVAILFAGSTAYLYNQNQQMHEFYKKTDFQFENLLQIQTIRKFVDNQYTYDSANFEKNQKLASHYLAPDLRSQQMRESESTAIKIKKDRVEQTSQLLSIQKLQDHDYQLTLRITNISKNDRLVLYNYIRIRIEKTNRSFENPDGYWITKWDQSISTDPFPLNLTIKTRPENVYLVSIPCAVNQIENQNSMIDINLSRGVRSEIQISNTTANFEKTMLEIFCEKLKFNLEIMPELTQNNHEVFKSLLLEQGTRNHLIKKPNPIANELKNDLGIIIESEN